MQWSLRSLFVAMTLAGALTAGSLFLPDTPPMEMFPLSVFGSGLLFGWLLGLALGRPYAGTLIGAAITVIPAYWLWGMVC